MTDGNIRELLTGDPTRRSVLKTGALAGAGAVLGASGTAAAQQDGGDDGVLDDQEWDKAIMPVSQFQPQRRFIITSPVLQWQPRVEDIQDNVWSEYNTRAIRYLNSNEMVLFWMAHDAEVPEFDQEAGYVVDAEGDTTQDGSPQPEIYRMRADFSPFGDSGYVTVNFAPVGEDEEDSFFDDDGDFFFEDDGDGEPAGIGDDVIDGNATGNVTDGNVTDGNQTDGNDSGVL